MPSSNSHGEGARPRGEAPVLAGAGWVGATARGVAGEKAAFLSILEKS